MNSKWNSHLLVIIVMLLLTTISLSFQLKVKSDQLKDLEAKLEVAKIEYDTVFIEAAKRGYVTFSAGLLVSNWVESPQEAQERLSKLPRKDIDEDYHKSHTVK